MTIPIEKSQIAKTTAQWEAQTPVLATNVIGIEVMNNGYNRYKRGNGKDTWKNLPYLDKKPPMQAHTHSAGQISGLPTSLPANGGNADTVDGFHENQLVKQTEYTDSQVLNKIKSVDGSGSGLDADTVDGKDASDFAPAGYGFGDILYNNKITNPLDPILKTGLYGMNTYEGNTTNAPETNFLGTIQVNSWANNSWKTVVAYNALNYATHINRYDENASAWQGWRQLESCRVLYNSTSGKNTGTVSLAETAANYKHLRIYYQRDGVYSSVDVFEPQGKSAVLQWGVINDTAVFANYANIYINGTSVTFTSSRDWWLTWSNSMGGATNRLWIMRIEGYN